MHIGNKTHRLDLQFKTKEELKSLLAEMMVEDRICSGEIHSYEDAWCMLTSDWDNGICVADVLREIVGR